MKRILTVIIFLSGIVILTAQNDAYSDKLTVDGWNRTMVFPQRHIVLIGCKICKNPKIIGVDRFSRRTQGWCGATDGRNEPHFIVKTMVPQRDCDEAFRQAGAVSRNRFSITEGKKRLKSGKISGKDYLDGSPALVSLRWKDKGKIREVPFERFFRERVKLHNGKVIEKEFTPHWVYHGSGVLNKPSAGCIVCQQDCPGGLICNNCYPCCFPVPELKPDWKLLPPPGTEVTLVIKILKEQ